MLALDLSSNRTFMSNLGVISNSAHMDDFWILTASECSERILPEE